MTSHVSVRTLTTAHIAAALPLPARQKLALKQQVALLAKAPQDPDYTLNG